MDFWRSSSAWWDSEEKNQDKDHIDDEFRVMYQHFSEMHEKVEETLKEVRAKEIEGKDEMQQDVECQVCNIGIEDDLDIDDVMHQIQSSGKIGEFTEYYDEICEKKKEGVPTARAPHLAKKERARKYRGEREREKNGS